MKNVIEVDGHKALVSYDPEIRMMRGEFLELNGGADFYAADVARLEAEGRVSLNVFLDMCAEKNIEPMRKFSGRFNLRLAPGVHKAAVIASGAEGKSLNEWVAAVIEKAAQAG